MMLDRYRCHKQVRAAAIYAIEEVVAGGEVRLVLTDGDFTIFHRVVTDEWIAKHEPKVGGYFIEYDDGYTSYSPAKAFQDGYTLVSVFTDFGGALKELKAGKRVARAGWNGSGMWLALIHPGNAMHTSSAGAFDMQPCVGIKTAQGQMQPGWIASQADMLAEDWVVLDD